MSYEKTAGEIAAMGDLAIVPVGSVEQHSRHLPVSTDIIIAQAYGDHIGARMGAFVLPCLPVSTAYEHKGAKGSVWMQADTFFRMLCDIVINLKEQGYRRVVIIKGHGGIFVMDPAVRHLNAGHMPDLKVCQLEPGCPDAYDRIFEGGYDLHAGECETSLLLHLRPELVKMDLAVDCVPDAPRPYLQYGSIFRYSPEGVWGTPTLATAEKGRLYFEAAAEAGIEYIEKIFGLMGSRRY